MHSLERLCDQPIPAFQVYGWNQVPGTDSLETGMKKAAGALPLSAQPRSGLQLDAKIVPLKYFGLDLLSETTLGKVFSRFKKDPVDPRSHPGGIWRISAC